MNQVNIYTDGGCSGNPGIGAWAFYVEEYEVEESANELHTTNNKMEMKAAINALKWAVANNITEVHIFTDSQYVQKGITEWIHTWKKNNWKNSAKKLVKNQDLWQALDDMTTRIDVHWHWVQGHAGHEGNERAHELVSKSIAALQP